MHSTKPWSRSTTTIHLSLLLPNRLILNNISLNRLHCTMITIMKLVQILCLEPIDDFRKNLYGNLCHLGDNIWNEGANETFSHNNLLFWKSASSVQNFGCLCARDNQNSRPTTNNTDAVVQRTTIII